MSPFFISVEIWSTMKSEATWNEILNEGKTI